MPGALLLARELMLIEFFHSEDIGADRECILYNLTMFLFSVTGWPKSVAKSTFHLSSLTSSVSPLRRSVADEVFPVISLIVSQALFA